MSDLISRADAIEAVKETKPIVRSTERNWGKMIAEQHSKELVKALKALPSADAEWIPCSERLPSEDGRYLATYPLMSGRNWISIKWFGKPNMTNRPIKGKCFYESDSEYGDVIWDNVIAWMPLPEPYREDGEA